MGYAQIKTGENLPEDINVIIEIPASHDPIKYEVDKDADVIVVDRFMATPMFYPANYGYIPHTLADDGDPLDALVITPYPLLPGCVIRSRPVGVLQMSDEGGNDAKLICVPHDSLTTMYANIKNITDVPALLRQQIQHFFENYKDLEIGKWVKIDEWGDRQQAIAAIQSSLQ